MFDAQACAICGSAILDMDLHTTFHSEVDSLVQSLSDTSADASEALEKAEYASNILYQRGLD